MIEPHLIKRLSSKYPKEDGWMYTAYKANLKKGNEIDMNHLGMDVTGKRKCSAAIKDDKGEMLDEFFFGNDGDGVHNLLSRIQSHGKCSTRAVLESTGNMWMRIHMLEEIGIDMLLANLYKTKIIATEAKIKSNNLML